MPTKRIFDLVVITALLLHPAVGVVRLSMRRHAAENQGTALGTVGSAVAVML
jgi:hypothetical protein